MTRPLRLACALVVTLIAPNLLDAQDALDRTKIPTPGPTPTLRVPAWTRTTLSNGAELVVSEKHDLPLVSVQVTFLGGSSQAEPQARRGLAGITAAMLSEGTTRRDGEAFSNALQLLGTTIVVNIAGETGSIGFESTSPRFRGVLDLLADMLVAPAFPSAALERLRAQRLVGLAQGRDRTTVIASRAFPRILFGDAHPYGQNVTEASLKSITRDDVVSFHGSYFQPGRALVSVVGDIRTAEAKAAIEQALAGWGRGGDKPKFDYPSLPSPRPSTIYLIDKPAAAQSTFAIGKPGPPRSTPDYFALQVMNTMLGGMFQSRLNANIREEKGYSYGVRSSFAYGKGPGAFRAGGDIVSAKSDAALVEFMKELRGIRGERPITDEELTTAKDSLIQRLPSTFASVQGINDAIVRLWTQGLPDDYYQGFTANIAAVTRDDVVRVARQYVDVDHLSIVIVGDRAAIEAPLRATGIAPIVIADIEGGLAASP
jgi:predicted Zn-dependent peptidase